MSTDNFLWCYKQRFFLPGNMQMQQETPLSSCNSTPCMQPNPKIQREEKFRADGCASAILKNASPMQKTKEIYAYWIGSWDVGLGERSVPFNNTEGLHSPSWRKVHLAPFAHFPCCQNLQGFFFPLYSPL